MPSRSAIARAISLSGLLTCHSALIVLFILSFKKHPGGHIEAAALAFSIASVLYIICSLIYKLKNPSILADGRGMYKYCIITFLPVSLVTFVFTTIQSIRTPGDSFCDFAGATQSCLPGYIFITFYGLALVFASVGLWFAFSLKASSAAGIVPLQAPLASNSTPAPTKANLAYSHEENPDKFGLGYAQSEFYNIALDK